MGIIDDIKKSGIETNIGKRGDHHPKAEKLARILGEIDYVFCDDSFCFKFGGDGDNGETLTYLLDIFFDYKDRTGFSLRKET